MLTPRARFSTLPLRPHAQAFVPRRVFVMAMARSESLESKCVGPADATMTQTLSRIMKMDDEKFAGKYVTMKAVLRYGVVSSAILG